MSLANQAMEQIQFCLGLAIDRARELQFVLALGTDAAGRPAVLVLANLRHSLAAALRGAADACEDLGVQQGDLRWTAPVALIHNASTLVWAVRDARIAGQIAALMERMRVMVVMLRERSMARPVGVRLN